MSRKAIVTYYDVSNYRVKVVNDEDIQHPDSSQPWVWGLDAEVMINSVVILESERDIFPAIEITAYIDEEKQDL